MYKIKRYAQFSSAFIVWILIFALITAFSVVGIGVSSERGRKESAEILERSVRRAAVQCYAIEGFYPSDIGYLVDNYGLDTSGYIVHYGAFASNLMPDIRVISEGE